MNFDTVDKVLVAFSDDSAYGQIYFARFAKTVQLSPHDVHSDYGKRCIEKFSNGRKVCLQLQDFRFNQNFTFALMKLVQSICIMKLFVSRYLKHLIRN